MFLPALLLTSTSKVFGYQPILNHLYDLFYTVPCNYVLLDLGIDRLERLKGIPLKLIAIEQFMEEQPQWRGKLVFSMIGKSMTSIPCSLPFLHSHSPSLLVPFAQCDCLTSV